MRSRVPWRLVVKNLVAHPLRASLTVGSLVVAVFLLCFLRSVLVGLEAGVQASASNRCVVQSAVSLFVDLPLSYQSKIASVEGVEQTCKLQWFGGIYQDPSNFFAQFGVDEEVFLDTYPEVEVVEGSAEAFQRQRTACLIGRGLAERFGWEVGDRVPLIGTIFTRTDGRPWEFEVAGVYRSTGANVDENTMWFHYDYLDETLEQGGAFGPRGVGVYVLRLEPGTSLEAVSAEVEGLFANGPQRVQATSEAEFQRQFVSMLGSVPTFLAGIGGGVLFAIVLAVLNTMLMAARERTQALGVMKALGFGDAVMAGLLLAESLLLCLTGGGLGVALAKGSEPVVASGLQQILPTFTITPETMVLGLGLSVAIGVLAGVVPAIMAARLRCVDALRAEV